MSKELDADMLVMERSEVLANAANLARLVRDVRTVLDNFVSYTLRSEAPAAPRTGQPAASAQKPLLRREVEQSCEAIARTIAEVR